MKTKPHEILRDYYVNRLGLTHRNFRGLNEEQFAGILSGEVRISPEAAASLAATLNTEVSMWIDLQDMADRWDR